MITQELALPGNRPSDVLWIDYACAVIKGKLKGKSYGLYLVSRAGLTLGIDKGKVTFLYLCSGGVTPPPPPPGPNETRL